MTCAEVPVYGPVLPLSGICNAEGTAVATGTFITDAYDERGRANLRPKGLRVASLRLRRPSAQRNGVAVARFARRRGARYPARRHVVAILLADAVSGTPVGVDYRAATKVRADSGGNVAEARLELPKGTSLPARVMAYVITDAFPLARREL